MKSFTIVENVPYNRQINMKIYAQYGRGRIENNNLVLDDTSNVVWTRYRIHLATRAGNWFGYPIYVQSIEAGGRTLEGGYQIKAANPNTFDILHVTGWHATESTSGVVPGIQVVISDSTGNNTRTGYYTINEIPRRDPYVPSNVSIHNRNGGEHIDVSNLDYVLVHWQHWGGERPVKIEYSLDGNRTWKNGEIDNPFRVPVDRGTTYTMQVRGVDAQGRTGFEGNNPITFTTKSYPTLEVGSLLELGHRRTTKYSLNIRNHNQPVRMTLYGSADNANFIKDSIFNVFRDQELKYSTYNALATTEFEASKWYARNETIRSEKITFLDGNDRNNPTIRINDNRFIQSLPITDFDSKYTLSYRIKKPTSARAYFRLRNFSNGNKAIDFFDSENIDFIKERGITTNSINMSNSLSGTSGTEPMTGGWTTFLKRKNKRSILRAGTYTLKGIFNFTGNGGNQPTIEIVFKNLETEEEYKISRRRENARMNFNITFEEDVYFDRLALVGITANEPFYYSFENLRLEQGDTTTIDAIKDILFLDYPNGNTINEWAETKRENIILQQGEVQFDIVSYNTTIEITDLKFSKVTSTGTNVVKTLPTGDSSFTLTDSEVGFLHGKATNRPLTVRFENINNEVVFNDTYSLPTLHDFTVPSLYSKNKNTNKKVQVYIKKNGNIKRAITYIRKHGEINRGRGE